MTDDARRALDALVRICRTQDGAAQNQHTWRAAAGLTSEQFYPALEELVGSGAVVGVPKGRHLNYLPAGAGR